MKKPRLPILWTLLFVAGLFFCPLLANEPVEDFLKTFEMSLREKDFSTFRSLFVPEIQEREERALRGFFTEEGMEEAAVFRAGPTVMTEEGAQVYLKVMFENPFSVIIQVWRLDLAESGGRWHVREKTVTQRVEKLYKIAIPSGREERASRVEIRHVDVHFQFSEAVVFYDNIPDAETALLVIGKGELVFSPSHPREKHQLQLLYDKQVLRDTLTYAYVRCSPDFFEENVRIETSGSNPLPVSETERNRAYSLFAKHYPRSFTIANSLTGELLTFLPQGDEAVIAFVGRKIGEFTYIFSPFSEEEITLYDRSRNRFVNLYSPRDEKGAKRFFISFGEKFDVKDYQIDVDFNPSGFYLSGKARVRVASNVGFLDEVKFKIHPDLEILRIVDEKKNELFFTEDKLRKALYVYFLHPVPRSQTASIEVYYRGRIEPPRITEDAAASPQLEEVMRLVPHRYETYLYSLSSYWYPAPPEGDYFTARVKLIIPPKYDVIANGILVEESQLEMAERVEELEKVGRKVCVYESRHPVKYLSFIVGEFVTQEEVSEPIPLRYVRTPETRLPRWDLFKEVRNILRFYQQKFGAFPFDRLTIVHRVWKESGGHSPASFIVLNQLPRVRGGGRLVEAESPVNLNRWKEHFLAHEIAHQWWGQAVTWDTYHDQWISEGLAQFSSILYLREKYGDAAFGDILRKISRWTRKKGKWGAVVLGSRISYLDFLGFQTIVYNKTALILNMLKDMLGDEVFFRGLQEFFRRHRFSPVRTHDFVAALSEASARDLRPFFKPWFESFALPDVRITRSVKKQGDGYRLELNVAQSGEVFVFPLWVEWSEASRRMRRMFIVDQRNQMLTVDLAVRPGRIRINPERAVPGRFR